MLAAPSVPVCLTLTLTLGATQDESEVFAPRPPDAVVRANASAKRSVLAEPADERVVRVPDGTFFAALDPGHAGMRDVLALAEDGDVETAWLAFDRFMREDWEARSDLRRLDGIEPSADAGATDPLAQAITNGVVEVREHRYDLSEPTDWTQNAGTNSFAALHFWQWARPLGDAYLRTRRARYAEAFDRLFSSWYDARGEISTAAEDLDVVWYELGTAQRSLHLACLAYAMRSAPELRLETRKDLYRSLLGHANRLQALEECGYTDGNFQVGAASALYDLGLMLPVFADARLWRETGKARLVEHAFWDFDSDGGHAERTYGYSMGIVVRMNRLLRNTRDDPEPGDVARLLEDRVRAMERWFLDYVTPSGDLPGVNDSHFEHGAEWLKSLASYSGDGRFLWPIRGRDDLPEGIPPVRPERTTRHLGENGWTIFREGWDSDDLYMLVNWGRWGSSHTHDGLLDLNVYGFGRPLVVEAGRFGSYDEPLDAWFRGADAHNQVCLEGRMLDRRRAFGRVIRWRDGEHVEYLEAFHDGYRQDVGIRLRRHILFVVGDYWLVLDTIQHRDRQHAELSGKEPPAAILTWHSPYPWAGDSAGLLARAEGGPGVRLAVWPELAPELEADYVDQRELYGARHRVELAQPAAPGARFVTLIAPFAETPLAASLEVEPLPNVPALAVTVSFEGRRDRFLVRLDGEAASVQHRGLSATAVVAWRLEDPPRGGLVDGSRLAWEDEALLELPEVLPLAE